MKKYQILLARQILSFADVAANIDEVADIFGVDSLCGYSVTREMKLSIVVGFDDFSKFTYALDTLRDLASANSWEIVFVGQTPQANER